MLDFRTTAQGRPVAPGRGYARWMWLVFLGAVVVVLALQPGTWQSASRLLRGQGPGPAHGDPHGPAIDNRLDLAGGDGQAGEAAAQPGPAPHSEKPGPRQSIGGLTKEQLDSIQDDSPPRRAEEAAWLRLLQVLHDTEEEAIRRATSGPATYAELFRQSGAYRGRLVTVRGELRRAHRIAAPPNPWGQEHYFQTWLRPADDPSSPLQVYCLALPEGFPLGMAISEEVEITGFYFKRSAYKARDTLRTAPTLVAKTVQWFPSTGAEEHEPPGPGGTLVMVAGVFVLAVAAAVLMVRRAGRRPRFEVARTVDLSGLSREDGPPGP